MSEPHLFNISHINKNINTKELVRLFIHKNQTPDDLKAKELFEQIVSVLKSDYSLYDAPEFKIISLESKDEDCVPTLPCLSNGTFWNGLDQIELFLKYHKNHTISPLGY